MEVSRAVPKPKGAKTKRAGREYLPGLPKSRLPVLHFAQR
jgi:hypothetical protein